MRHRLLVITLVGSIVLAPAPAVAATPVSYSALLTQIESGPVIRAVINRGRGDVEIKFRDLSEWEAFYPAGAQPTLQRLLHARHIRVLFASRHAAIRSKSTIVHHHLRYIAAGVIGALAVIGGGAFLYSRRRRATTALDAGTPPA
ncbi:MAG TPA: hypothetical protein VES65_03695 [Solirubrobacteraceae bacterium]|nr:hypothetical protein [Solirubrobacteraceae bacterium]